MKPKTKLVLASFILILSFAITFVTIYNLKKNHVKAEIVEISQTDANFKSLIYQGDELVADITDNNVVTLKPGDYKLVLFNESLSDAQLPTMEFTINETLTKQVVPIDINSLEDYNLRNDEIIINAEVSFVDPTINCPGSIIARGFLDWHKGIDIVSVEECSIIASTDGKVITSQFGTNGEGFYVEVEGNDGIVTRYEHGALLRVSVDTFVKQGELIMDMGCTGNCTDTHLHFEIVKDGVSVDPKNYIDFGNK